MILDTTTKSSPNIPSWSGNNRPSRGPGPQDPHALLQRLRWVLGDRAPCGAAEEPAPTLLLTRTVGSGKISVADEVGVLILARSPGNNATDLLTRLLSGKLRCSREMDASALIRDHKNVPLAARPRRARTRPGRRRFRAS